MSKDEMSKILYMKYILIFCNTQILIHLQVKLFTIVHVLLFYTFVYYNIKDQMKYVYLHRELHLILQFGYYSHLKIPRNSHWYSLFYQHHSV